MKFFREGLIVMTCLSVSVPVFSMEIEKNKKLIVSELMSEKKFFKEVLPKDIWVLVMDMLPSSDPAYKYLLRFFAISPARAKAFVDSIEDRLLSSYRAKSLQTAVKLLRQLATLGQLKIPAGQAGQDYLIVKLPPTKQVESRKLVQNFLNDCVEKYDEFLGNLEQSLFEVSKIEENNEKIVAIKSYFCALFVQELRERGYGPQLGPLITTILSRQSNLQHPLPLVELKEFKDKIKPLIKSEGIKRAQLLAQICLKFENSINTYKHLLLEIAHPEHVFWCVEKRAGLVLAIYCALPSVSLLTCALLRDKRMFLINLVPLVHFMIWSTDVYKGQRRELWYDIFQDAKKGFGLIKRIFLKKDLGNMEETAELACFMVTEVIKAIREQAELVLQENAQEQSSSSNG